MTVVTVPERAIWTGDTCEWSRRVRCSYQTRLVRMSLVVIAPSSAEAKDVRQDVSYVKMCPCHRIISLEIRRI